MSASRSKNLSEPTAHEYMNRYHCNDPETGCGYRWSDTWDAKCDDDCPRCGDGPYEPYYSKDVEYSVVP